MPASTNTLPVLVNTGIYSQRSLMKISDILQVGCKIAPLFVRGKVVKGMRRGGKELGIPTANYPEGVVASFSDSLGTGIYYGWASVDNGTVYKMVMSVGWNPYYKNQKKSMETHIIHKFEEDFYGAELSCIILGYLRPEKSFPSLESLIEAITNDVDQAKECLDKPENTAYSTHPFFLTAVNSTGASTSATNGVNSNDS